MSKQLKYKLKKTLKNAEFVHADLEYHEQLSKDAVREFHEEIARLISLLSEEEREQLQKQQAPPPPPPMGAEPEMPSQLNENSPTSDSNDVVPSDAEPEEDETPVPPVD